MKLFCLFRETPFSPGSRLLGGTHFPIGPLSVLSSVAALQAEGVGHAANKAPHACKEIERISR